MNHRKILTGMFSFLCLCILILDGKTALAGAAAGIELCLKTVIPSLLPFLFFCAVLTDSLWGCHVPGFHHLSRLLGIPEGGGSLLLSAFLGGYPAGAQQIGEAYRQNRLSRQRAEHLLRFSSNAGPAFLFGMTALQFPNQRTVWMLWAIQIASPLITGLLDTPNTTETTTLSRQETTVSEHLMRSIRSMALICGWIILFRMLTEFLNLWILWWFPAEIQVLAAGLLELSNGCCILQSVENLSVRFVLCSVMLSFGGLCVAMQTASVIGELSFQAYLLGKLTQTIISLLLSILVISQNWIMLLLASGAVAIFLRRRKKVVAFHGKPMYNADINSGGHPHAVP